MSAYKVAILVKAFIRLDVKRGVIPAQCKGFSVIHDSIDANEYLEDACDALGLDIEESTLPTLNAALDTVDSWIKRGGMFPENR